MYIDQVRSQLNHNEIRERVSDDVQNSFQSHHECKSESENTSNCLDHKLKEPRSILFFKGSVYEFTYNEDGKCNQSQLWILMEVPDQEDLNRFRKITILVSPSGLKVVEFDGQSTSHYYIDKGWVLQYVVMEPERIQHVNLNMKGQRYNMG